MCSLLNNAGVIQEEFEFFNGIKVLKILIHNVGEEVIPLKRMLGAEEEKMCFILRNAHGTLVAYSVLWSFLGPLVPSCLYSETQHPQSVSQSEFSQEFTLNKRERFSEVSIIGLEICNGVVSSQFWHL